MNKLGILFGGADIFFNTNGNCIFISCRFKERYIRNNRFGICIDKKYILYLYGS